MSQSQTPAIFHAQLPTFLANVDPNMVAQMNAEAANGTGGGQSIPKVSIKGSRFSIVVGGEVKATIHGQLDLVVVRANMAASKTWYAKPWQQGAEPEVPDCFSNDGIRPHSDARAAQCETCAMCPHNEWGSKVNPVTHKANKACTDSKRIAVVPDGALDSQMFQLNIPPASLAEWNSYLKVLAHAKVTYNMVVTRATFDINESYPKLKFEPVRYLTEAEYRQMVERYDCEESRLVAALDNGVLAPRIAGPSVTAQLGQAPAHLQQPAQQPQYQQQPQQPQYQQQTAPEQQAQGGWGAPAQVPQVQPQYQQQPQQPQQPQGGWGTAAQAQPQQPQYQQQAAPVQQVQQPVQQAQGGWGVGVAQSAQQMQPPAPAEAPKAPRKPRTSKTQQDAAQQQAPAAQAGAVGWAAPAQAPAQQAEPAQQQFQPAQQPVTVDGNGVVLPDVPVTAALASVFGPNWDK